MSEINNVPQGQVGETVQDYVDGGRTDKVTATKQADGKWTVKTE